MRKLIETLREYAEWADASIYDVPITLPNTLRRAADAIEELSKPHWIPVTERLPEFGERVLVSNGGFVCESFLSQSGKWQRSGVDMFFMTPTHWMPLPEPPKEE